MERITQADAAPPDHPQTGKWKGRAALAGASLAFVLGAAHFYRGGQHGLVRPGCSGDRRPGCGAVPRSCLRDWPRNGA